MELCIHSDIDILILFGSKMPVRAKNLSDEIFLPLWDLGLDLGYGIRAIKDCISLSKEDFEVLTSLMDARFICGDSPLFLSMTETLQKKVVSRKAATFGRWLQGQDKIRMAKFGDARYLLEPNLKEGQKLPKKYWSVSVLIIRQWRIFFFLQAIISFWLRLPHAGI